MEQMDVLIYMKMEKAAVLAIESTDYNLGDDPNFDNYSESSPYGSENNGKWDKGEEFEDIPNGKWDKGEKLEDHVDGRYNKGESYQDGKNGVYDEGRNFY